MQIHLFSLAFLNEINRLRVYDDLTIRWPNIATIELCSNHFLTISCIKFNFLKKLPHEIKVTHSNRSSESSSSQHTTLFLLEISKSFKLVKSFILSILSFSKNKYFFLTNFVIQRQATHSCCSSSAHPYFDGELNNFRTLTRSTGSNLSKQQTEEEEEAKKKRKNKKKYLLFIDVESLNHHFLLLLS